MTGSVRRPGFKYGAVAIAVGLAVGFAGCADANPAQNPGVGAPGSASPPSKTGTPQSAPTTTPARPASATPTAAAELDAAHCLEGNWVVDNQYFLLGMREFGPETTSVTGTVTVAFGADGRAVTTYDNWRITAAFEGQSVEIVRNGVDEGRFDVTDDLLALWETNTTSTLELSGEGLSMTIAAEPLDFNSVPVTCNANQATIIGPDGTALLTR